jgi:hypothetical protein
VEDPHAIGKEEREPDCEPEDYRGVVTFHAGSKLAVRSG